jgi:uncharacterized protein (DUF1778 family)
MLELMKEIRINVRTTDDVKRDLEITARIHGRTVSNLVNWVVRQAIQEAKASHPQEFASKPNPNKRQTVAVLRGKTK